MDKFWKFNPVNNGNVSSAELILYGDIASRESWWGNNINPQTFSEELIALGDIEELTVRINSGGGDVYAANAIYARLRDHSAKVVVKIDGWAGSAATIIAMAADEGELYIPANAVFMIHDPAIGFYGYYGKEDLEQGITIFENCKKSITKAYSLRTGKTEEEISGLMQAETYWTGEEAVENGFCDSLMFGDLDVAVNNSNFAVVNSVALDISKLSKTQQQKIVNHHSTRNDFTYKKSPVINHKPKERRQMEIENASQLTSEYPALVAEIQKQAVDEERKRIQDIEDSVVPGFEEIVNKAKFDEPKNAGEVALEIIKAQRQQGKNYLEERETDVAVSNIENVKSIGIEGAATSSAETSGKDTVNSAFDEVEKELGGKQ